MASIQEGTFTTRDGTSLYTKTWKSSKPSPLHLVFIHGFSDHINAYYDLFPTLSREPYNITIYGFDQRGWGRSVPKGDKSARGRTGDTQLVMSDIYDFVVHISTQIRSSNSSTSSGDGDGPSKLFLMGHSMGGAEALYYLLASPSVSATFQTTAAKSGTEDQTTTPLPVTGLIVESPHIAFPKSSQPSQLLVVSGRLASKVLPNQQKLQKLDSSAMSRNPQVCKDWDDDELCHDTGTLKGLAGLLDRADGLNALGRDGNKGGGLGAAFLDKLSCPVFWAHGTADQVCDFEGSKRLFGRVAVNADGYTEFKGYEGGYHKLHGEPDGMAEEFARDIGGWIVKVAGGAGAKQGVAAE